jgi:DNA invertase Pin-like site-specific DNA recombinase
VGHKIGYARVSTADQDPHLQLDALNAEGCLKIYKDVATGTKADRPQWTACLAELRPGDTLIIWKIDRLGRNLRDLVDIVAALEARDVGVKSLTNGIVDTTTAQGKLVFGMFALMAEYEAALIKERTLAGLAAARARGRTGGRKPKMTSALVDKAQRMYDSRQFTMAEIAASCGVTPMTIYRNIRTISAAPSEEVTATAQGVDLGVPWPGHLGSAALLTIGRRARLGDRFGLGPVLEAAAVSTHDPVDGLGEVLQQVETVSDLDRLRRTKPATFGIPARTVTTNHLSAWVSAQPGGEGIGAAVGQQVNGPAGVHVDDDAAVGVALAEREIVDADHGDRAGLGHR